MNKPAENKSNIAGKLNIPSEVEFIFGAPKFRKERDLLVITERFGLDGKKNHTLEEIGKSLGITRERVRQIEKNSMKKLRDFLTSDLRGQEISQFLSKIISANGNVIEKKGFQEAVIGNTTAGKNVSGLNFILSCIDGISETKETAELKSGYLLGDINEKTVVSVIRAAVKILETEKQPIEESAFLKMLHTEFPKLNTKTLASMVTLAKKIIRTDTGHMGLSHWRDINPKSIKDKTYYLLKKHQKPLHYTEISDRIQGLGAKEKKVTRQAVHNELIRDERFVLIGRGIYALSEWGYTGGVVEEVIVEILMSTEKPMHKDAIIEEVLKRRIVKETTILLNLQKKRFKRVARATYAMADRGEGSDSTRH